MKSILTCTFHTNPAKHRVISLAYHMINWSFTLNTIYKVFFIRWWGGGGGGRGVRM